MLQIEELWVCCIPQDTNRQYEGFLAKSVVVKGDLKWFRMWKCFSQQFHSNSNENSYVQAGGPLHSLRCKKPIKFLASCVTFLGRGVSNGLRKWKSIHTKKMFELSELNGSVGSPPMCQQLINDFFGQVCIVQPSGRYSLVATLIEGVKNYIFENHFKV